VTGVVLVLALLAIDGQVVNKSTGQPAAGVEITLIQAGQGGMRPVDTVQSGADGRFVIPAREAAPGMVSMLQAKFKGVTYNRVLPPNAPSQGMEVAVFDTTTDTSAAQVGQHMIVLEHVPGELRVTETVMVQNPTQRTLSNPQGTLRFYVPPAAADKVRVSAASGAQGMPLNRPAMKTGEPNVYAVDFPVKPGDTRFDISWTTAFATPGEFQGRVLHKEGKTNLIVPRGMSLKGDKLTDLGVEPRTQASIYGVNYGAFSATVEGAGTLRNPAAESEEDGGGGTPVDILPPKIYDRVYFVLAFAFGILGIAFYRLYRRPAA
jgi:hypothetical protein